MYVNKINHDFHCHKTFSIRPSLSFRKKEIGYLSHYAHQTENDYEAFLEYGEYLDPLLLTLVNVITGWINDHTPSNVRDEITYQSPIFNGCKFNWMSDLIPHFIMDAITYTYRD